MPLQSFSAPIVDERFRVKLAFDTNLLMYLLDNSYPKLTEATIHLNDYKSFVDLITNRYTLFELYEKRKEAQFINVSARNGFGTNAINSDKFSVHNKLKYERILYFISFRKLLGARIHSWLHKKLSSAKHKSLIESGLFFQHREEIANQVRAEIPRLEDDFGIEITGSLHDGLWTPTFELIFNSRVSREDSLIAIAFLKPDAIRNEKNTVILTNDGDFRSFYVEAREHGLITPLFQAQNLSEPTIDRITELRRTNNSVFNLRANQNYSASEAILDYVKSHIINNNSPYFLGHTDHTIAPNNPEIIGLRLRGAGQYRPHQNLLVIGHALDFFYEVPYGITEFRDFNQNPITFPLSQAHDRVCYRHTPLDAEDPDKVNEQQLLIALKESGNLVFVHPDIP